MGNGNDLESVSESEGATMTAVMWIVGKLIVAVMWKLLAYSAA